ncbi:hypothetical protein ACFLR4_04400 [Bacteroidota bacterium]
MGGKASLFLVIGFSIIFMTITYNWGNLSVNAIDNVVGYYEETIAHNIAVSGTNIALNSLFLNGSWNAGYHSVDFQGGTLDVDISSSGGTKIVESVGTYQGISKSVVVKIQTSSFAKFGWYIENMSSKILTTGDTIYGAFHSQSTINIDGSPVFYGKVTTAKGFSPAPKLWESKGHDPKFYGGFETGVDLPFPSSYTFADQKAAALDGVNNEGGSSLFQNIDLWMKFYDDGTLTYRTGWGPDTASYNAATTLLLTDFAPTGIIYVGLGDIYMSGTIDGQVTIVAGESSGLGNGNVYLVDDLIYKETPMVYAGDNQYDPTSSDDMVGILATNNLIIANTPENDSDITIHASIFCAAGGVQAQDLNFLDDQGRIFLQGGVIASKEEQVVKVENDGTFKGFKKHVVFDERFLLTSPPLFPITDKYEIVSWYE